MAARATAVNTAIAVWHNERDRVRGSRMALSDTLLGHPTRRRLERLRQCGG